jgi:anthranilate phosphoribosyltransferase
MFVVHGDDGLDEITTTTATYVGEVKDGTVRTYEIRPGDFGLPTASPDDLRGGSPEENALILRALLDGEQGPRRDILIVNAAAAITAGGKAPDLKAGLALAAQSIDSGAARAKLDQLIAFTQRYSA